MAVKTDFFADIAANHVISKKEKLTESRPLAFTKVSAPLQDDHTASNQIPSPMSTHAELKQALAEMRQQYAPFLQNLAPSLPATKTATELTDFVLNGEEPITLPHYGGPLGFAVKDYTTTFQLPCVSSAQAVYLAFGGVDYIATVYVNGNCVGRHEGFFSPFEFDVSRFVRSGENTLRVEVENDCKWNGTDGVEGDKIYAATGLGYDDPEVGWHHCPPGMGIYNYVRLEIRNKLNITDVYVRPLPEESAAELWVEVDNATYESIPACFDISIYGQNFEAVALENHRFTPVLAPQIEEDSVRTLCNASEVLQEQSSPVYAKRGKNIYKMRVPVRNFKLWTLDNPYLYQAQVKVYNGDTLCDCRAQQFGMRSFSQDVTNAPKGRLYLNGNLIKLRGANTMGFEQQDVLNKDFDQLIDDILLAKICNMNFWRLTQRPVQDEIYEYCDKLGLMTQTDMPLFSCIRRNKLAELVRQTEEMVRMVRKHPCNVMISYINEPFVEAFGSPNRHYERWEMEEVFEILDKVVQLSFPDGVIKHVDGDYDPPTRNCIQDNHTYTLWYNNHEIEFGRLHKGYWVDYDQEWCCGCGEYGAEGLDPVDLMKRRYPKEWLKEPFHPDNIIKAQSGSMQHDFFEMPQSLEEWVSATQEHQAFAAKIMTEAFRRKPEMVTSAIHLFIDAWPSGWMKTIMDCERTPKPAYFTYRNALSPILVSLRSDRFTYYAGETVSIETYLCNDTNREDNSCHILYELYNSKGEKCKSATVPAIIRNCDVTYIANAEFSILQVSDRERYLLKAAVFDSQGEFLSANEFAFEVFEDVTIPENEDVVLVSGPDIGTHTIAGKTVTVYQYPWNQGRHFVSANTGHPAVSQFRKNDFRFWYDAQLDRISPVANSTFQAEGFTPILISQNTTVEDNQGMCMVVGEKTVDGKRYIVSTLNTRTENPVAKRFLKALME